MTYRNKKSNCCWRHGSRYGYYVAKLRAEEEKKKALLESRTSLVNVFAALADKKSQEYWDSETIVLKNMKKELEELGKVPSIFSTVSVIKYCIKLFDITSRAQDALPNGRIQVAPEEKSDAVDAFNNDLYYSGRHCIKDLRNDSFRGPLPYWNTTLEGTPINEETIMFGPEIGRVRKPASYWLKLSKKKKVYVEENTAYVKGNITKLVPVWETDALVKTGIHNFCKTAVKALTAELDILLE